MRRTETRINHVQQEPQIPHWSLATRVAFRFCFAYFGLYCLVTQILGGLFRIPGVSFPDLATLWPMNQITLWTAGHVFDITTPLVYSKATDTTFQWVQALCLLVVAVLATGIWSFLDRERENYVSLHKWFRLFMRFALASQMFEYGIAKIVPTQMPFLSLTTLVEPVGNVSLQGLLWVSIGASPAYEIITGCAEVLGGILLLVPLTTMFGALICLAELLQVFILNMTYDVGVKLFSFHLILLALFLLAPDLPRLAGFFFLDRAAVPSSQPQLFGTPRASRIALAVQILFGIYLAGMCVPTYLNYWYADGGGGSPKSPLYGIWDVDQLSIDGQLRPPLLNDYDRRWRRVIFESPTSMVFQRTDDSFAHYGASIDVVAKTLALTKGNSRNWKASFIFQRPAQDQLILDGDMDNYKIHMQLQLVGFDRFRLLNSGFRWIRRSDE